MMPGPDTTALLRSINERFARGHASSNLSEAGVLVHQFDGTTNFEYPWLPCPPEQWCNSFNNRISASLINSRLPFLFKEGGVGMILAPKATSIRCSYFVDGGTMSKTCEQHRDGCVAGCCDQFGRPNWCGPDLSLASQTIYGCAFRPLDLEAMLRHHELRRDARQYNEVVVDLSSWDAERSVEAFYYVDGFDAKRGLSHERWARDLHERFHQRYSSRNVDVLAPLLHFRVVDARGKWFTRVA